MFCKYCGKVIDDDSVFCDGCGKNLKETGAKTVYVPTTVKDNSYKTAPESSPKTQYTQPVKPNPVPQQRNDYTQAPRVEEKPQYFQQPARVNPTPTQKAEIPDTPLTQKKSIVPYILLPIAVLFSLGVSFFTSMASTIFTGFFTNEMGFEPVMSMAMSNLVTILINILPQLIPLILFSLCCKGANKKLRFIGSYYASQFAGYMAALIFSVVAGYVMLYTIGFHNVEASTIYGGTNVVGGLINFFINPFVALLWFAMSEKYIVKKGEKNSGAMLIVQCVLIAVFGLIFYVLDNSYGSIALLLNPLFGEYSITFSNNLAQLITLSVAYTIMFLIALAFKGGYRKLTFVGSFFFSRAMLKFVTPIVGFIGALIPNEGVVPYATSLIVGNCISGVIATALSIVLYILLNRYKIEKIKKIKE